jgi:hypothetical protein
MFKNLKKKFKKFSLWRKIKESEEIFLRIYNQLLKWSPQNYLFIGIALVAKDVVFRFIIEYSSLNFHNFSFALKYVLFNVNGKVIMWHTPCLFQQACVKVTKVLFLPFFYIKWKKINKKILGMVCISTMTKLSNGVYPIVMRETLY